MAEDAIARAMAIAAKLSGMILCRSIVLRMLCLTMVFMQFFVNTSHFAPFPLHSVVMWEICR